MEIMLPRFIPFALFSMIFWQTSAQSYDGGSSYAFMDIPLSSRIYGLGGVNITLVDDHVSDIDQNPALLGPEMSGQSVLSYMRYMEGSNFAGVRYAHSAGKHSAWSAAAQYFGYGSITMTDEHGNELGIYSPIDAVFMGAFSHDIIDGLRGGINMKFAYSSISEYTALAIAADIGLNYYDPDKDISLSIVAANLGGQVKRFDKAYEKVPADLRIGWSQTFGKLPIRFSATVWKLTHWNLPYYSDGKNQDESVGERIFRHLVLGADLVSSKAWHIGIGYNFDYRARLPKDSRSALTGLSATAGIQNRHLGIGLAIVEYGHSTNLMLNLLFTFGK